MAITKEEHKRLLNGELPKGLNVAVSDEDMSKASGGVSQGIHEPKFNIGERVRVLEDDWIDDAYVTDRRIVGDDYWMYILRVHDIEEGWYENYKVLEIFLEKY